MTHSDIISRLEKATGREKETDRKIARFFGWFRVEPRFSRNKNGGWIAPEDFLGSYADGSPILDGLHGTTIHGDVPNFTGSLDTTVAEVEKQGFLWLRKSFNTMTVTRPLTEEQDARKEWAKHFDAAGATPAIALLIALFKALPSDDKDNG